MDRLLKTQLDCAFPNGWTVTGITGDGQSVTGGHNPLRQPVFDLMNATNQRMIAGETFLQIQAHQRAQMVKDVVPTNGTVNRIININGK